MNKRFDDNTKGKGALDAHQGQDPMDSVNMDIAREQRRIASRRRFVKGAAIAAPAVMTLRGGQALAQTSFSNSACQSEMSAMGQKAQNAMGDELYFVVNVDQAGNINVTPAEKGDRGAQTVSLSCFASLV